MAPGVSLSPQEHDHISAIPVPLKGSPLALREAFTIHQAAGVTIADKMVVYGEMLTCMTLFVISVWI